MTRLLNIFIGLLLLAGLLMQLFTALPVSADWGPDVRLSYSLVKSTEPAIAVSGNFVHVAWWDYRDGDYAVYYSRSTDGGATWGAETRLSINGTGIIKQPSIAVSGNNVHVVWHDSVSAPNQIFYRRSTDGGATWGDEVNLSNSPRHNSSPFIAASGNNIHVVYGRDRLSYRDIWYKRSTDGGATWGTDTRLTNSAGVADSAAIAVSGNYLHVIWQDNRNGNWDIYYKRSLDGGLNWYTDTSLTTLVYSTLHSITVSGSNVHITWYDIRDGKRALCYKRSTDSGAFWGVDTTLSKIQPYYRAAIASSRDKVYVIWCNGFTLYYKQSPDSGTNWGPDTNLTSNKANSFMPAIAAACNDIHIAWRYDRDANNDNEIYYKKFTAPAPIITSFKPALGAKDTRVVITGTNFTCATAVKFGNTNAARFTVDSDNKITAYIGNCDTGKVRVTTPNGTAVSNATFTCNAREEMIGTTPKGSWLPGTTSTTVPTQAVQQVPVALASISVKSAMLSATKVAPGTPVTVTADVVNTGNANGSGSIQVYVNGEVDNTQGVTVNSGSSTPVTFTVSRNEPGTYSVYVNGARAGSFTVDQFSPDTILIISGTMVFCALVLGAVYMTKRRQV